MGRNTIKMTESEIAQNFLESKLGMRGTFVRTVTRYNGEIDRKAIPNIVTADGLNHLANRAISDAGSKYNWLAIGTANYTPHINSQEILECDRKVGAVVGNSYELIVVIATWGGAADSVTSNQLEMAGIANHQTSGSGHYLNVANGLSTVLADSDFLHLEVQVQVGSHNITQMWLFTVLLDTEFVSRIHLEADLFAGPLSI